MLLHEDKRFMKCPSEIFGEVVVVHTPEELGDDQAETFEVLLTQLDRLNVVIDLDSTELIDSRGLTSLLNARDALSELGGDVKVATTNHCNRKILEITRLDQQLEVFESITDAVKSFDHFVSE
jgi:anti-anti-sigma factor